MSEQIDVQTKESEQVLEQNGAQQEVKAEAVDNVEKQVQPIIIPLQIMPCFYTGPFNNTPTKVAEEPVEEEKQEEPIPQKKVRFVRADSKEKKPKENCAKKKPLQIVCAVLLVLVCACMFALSFCGVVETDFEENLGSGLNVGLKVEYTTIDLIDFMHATTLDYRDANEIERSELGEEIRECQREFSESLRNDMQNGNSLSDETKKLVVKMLKLEMKARLSLESADQSAEEVHFILAGALSLAYIVISATMLALSIAWLVLVCQGKESNLGKVAVCITAVLFVLLTVLLLHMIELSILKFSIAITMICALAICGAVLLFAFILGIVRAPKGVRGMVAIKATSAVLVLSVIAFAFAPAIVHIAKLEASDIRVDKNLSQLESTILTIDELEHANFDKEDLKELSQSIEFLDQISESVTADGYDEEIIITIVDTYAEQAFLGSLLMNNSKTIEIFSLGYFMIFAVAIFSGICLALIFDFVLGGKNHQKAELALKVIIVVLTLFMLAICSSAIGIANAEYKGADVENLSAMIGYGIVMLALMSLFSLAIDSIVVGIANKRAKAPTVQDDSNPFELEAQVA